ncbi:MAG TPA: DPP IV N-terminal domain-containing protein [Thermomicrobiales bacterium]|nr:DPP IV N-terminal domain-containing protein [Thermomicrobiales bacterium]
MSLPSGEAAESSRSISVERYARAERYLPWNAARLLSATSVEPHWIGDGDTFWYRADTSDGSRYCLVDPVSGSVTPVFDHDLLAATLSRTVGTAFDPANLELDELTVAGDGQITVSSRGGRWVCDLAAGDCTAEDVQDVAPSDVVRSPDGQWDAFVRAHDLWLRQVSDGTETRLTNDGDAGYGYGMPLSSPLATAGLADPEGPVVHWSPDSSRFLSCRIDERPAKHLHLVQSVSGAGGERPLLHTYAYPLPGDADTELPLAEGWLFQISTENPGADRVQVQMDPLPMMYYGAPFQDSMRWWSPDGARLFLLTRARGGRSYTLHAIEAATGAHREVLTERTGQGIDPFLYWADITIRPLGDGAEILWYASRDGSGHLYLYDGTTGQLIRQLTSGPFNVSSLAHVHETERWVAFTAIGREPDRDPYHNQLYRISLDGGVIQLLTPDDGDHTVRFSPSGEFFLDTFSSTAVPPRTQIRSSTGALVADLGAADITSLLATGWRMPERFRAKARDGRTDVYGVVLRPSDLDPDASYPVIDYIYAGPQTNVAPTTFTDATPFTDDFRNGRGSGFWQAQAIAELGFVVVMVDGLGMPGRSRAYHDVSYRDLGDGGLPDHIAAIRQLADRYPYIDLSRAGIYGHSAGGYASAHAILAYPEFYKVCVSSAGNHDHRLDKASWVERYMGPEIGEHYEAQANRTLAKYLTGKLLLVHGEMDENVHPASTLALVDALIRANKDFDLLIIPNRPHRLDDDPYFLRRRWDYFVRHLLDMAPPPGYRIDAPPGNAEKRTS